MTQPEARAIRSTLKLSDLPYLLIRPADATPAEAPGILLADKTAAGIAYALAAAAEAWPNCERWALIGTAELLERADPAWPPTMRAPRTPAQLLTFSR